MMRDSYADRHRHPPLLESAEIVVALVLMSACWLAWYVARERYHLTSRQLAELATYLIIMVSALTGTAVLCTGGNCSCMHSQKTPGQEPIRG